MTQLSQLAALAAWRCGLKVRSKPAPHSDPLERVPSVVRRLIRSPGPGLSTASQAAARQERDDGRIRLAPHGCIRMAPRRSHMTKKKPVAVYLNAPAQNKGSTRRLQEEWRVRPPRRSASFDGRTGEIGGSEHSRRRDATLEKTARPRSDVAAERRVDQSRTPAHTRLVGSMRQLS